jgi:hypothetical protein
MQFANQFNLVLINDKGGGAWTAHQSDFGQYLLIDLGSQFTLEAIATKGRDYTTEYVNEFKVEYGNDGQDFSSYRDKNGDIKVVNPDQD